MDSLEKKGYMVIRGKLTKEDIAVGRACIREKTVNYTEMTRFIEQTMLATINQENGWSLTYAKYRVSDNNNADASTFHRDDVCLGSWIPALTCLTYLDSTVMEVIPGSHKILAADLLSAPSIYATRERITLNAGDLLVFYGTMLHRGILTETATTHRRLIQVFDCFHSKEDWAAYSARLVHVLGDEKSGGHFGWVSSIPGVHAASNQASFLNMITGCGNERSKYVLDSCGLAGTQRDVFCSEGFCKRTEVKPNMWQDINTYIMNGPHTDTPNSCKADWKWAFYTRQFVTYFAIILALLIALLAGGYVLIHRIFGRTRIGGRPALRRTIRGRR
jgi:hypothetical protein